MCFSVTASFTAGAILSVMGVATIKKVRTKSEIPLASIPLFFAVQQFIEAGVWLSFQYGFSFLNQVVTYAYLSFAYVLWPVLVPLAVGLLETDPHRKSILYVFQLIGVIIGVYLLYFIINAPVVSQIVGKSIAYSMPSQYGVFLVGMYFLATCASCLFSSHRIINILGVFAVVSFVITYYFYTASYVSVWCFFAAVLSGVVYLYFRRTKR